MSDMPKCNGVCGECEQSQVNEDIEELIEVLLAVCNDYAEKAELPPIVLVGGLYSAARTIYAGQSDEFRFEVFKITNLLLTDIQIMMSQGLKQSELH